MKILIDRTDAIRAAIEEGVNHTEPKEALVAINIALAIANILPIERTEDHEGNQDHPYTHA